MNLRTMWVILRLFLLSFCCSVVLITILHVGTDDIQRTVQKICLTLPFLDRKIRSYGYDMKYEDIYINLQKFSN
jgi:hypothetical protein